MNKWVFVTAVAIVLNTSPGLSGLEHDKEIQLKDYHESEAEELPTPEHLTGYFSVHKEEDVSEASHRAQEAAKNQASSAARAAEDIALSYAVQALKEALKAEAAVSVHQERAAHLSSAAQAAQAHSFTSAALATRLSKALFSLRSLETKVIDQAKLAKELAHNADKLSSLTIKITNVIQRLETDQQELSSKAKAGAKRLAHLQADALNKLSNAQVASNHAHLAAEAAKDFKITHPTKTGYPISSIPYNSEDFDGNYVSVDEEDDSGYQKGQVTYLRSNTSPSVREGKQENPFTHHQPLERIDENSTETIANVLVSHNFDVRNQNLQSNTFQDYPEHSEDDSKQSSADDEDEVPESFQSDFFYDSDPQHEYRVTQDRTVKNAQKYPLTRSGRVNFKRDFPQGYK